MIQNAIRTIRTLLPSAGSVTQEQIEGAVSIAMQIPQYASLDREQLIREVEELYNIRMDEFRVIEARERRRPWIVDKRTAIWGTDKTTFWTRYRDYLYIEKNFPGEVLSKLDRLTDRILDGLFDPAQNVIIDKRGLVVGQVQSGKTANYTGLICKAADAGFKLIIVLAGIHNNLRSQTQLRVDEGFLGFDTQHQRAFQKNNLRIGVGRIDQSIIAHSLTSSLENGDFSAGAANSLGFNFDTNEPIIAVVKKNASVLRRLNQWLSSKATELPDGRRVIRNKSLLLIDDEADNASINTNSEEDTATKINSLIRDTLRLFDRSGYVGYTATPFANIFIPLTEDDLFPRDFIVNLPAPSNYIGPDKVFGFELVEDDEDSENVLPIVRRIDDYQEAFPDKHKMKDPAPVELPQSLHIAIRCFILTCAVRRLRGQATAHNSMLIHVTRFIKWQGYVKELVENVFDYYRRGIEMNLPGIIEELRKTFEEDFTYDTTYKNPYTKQDETYTETYKSFVSTSQEILSGSLRSIDSQVQVHAWRDVLPHLNDAAAKITVREINGGSGDVLNYFDHQNGLSVIAIGGDKLSRGLTLEGLSVSYYLRASKMYDTLMQMGRWFGYRPGYADLCRLFISRELNEWFCHITLATQQLRDEFDYLADVAGSTPDQFAVRVRTHPGVLQISASNKIRKAEEVRVSWSGRLVESYELSKHPDVIKKNLDAATNLIQTLGLEYEEKNRYFLWRNKSLAVVKDFLRAFETYENLKSAAPANLLRFIEMNERFGELNNWSVAVMSKDRGSKSHRIGTVEIKLIKRTEDDKKKTDDLYYIRKSHIISPNDEFVDLSDDEVKEAKKLTDEHWEKMKKEGTPLYPSGEIVRNTIRKPNRPLLIIYFLDPVGAGLPGSDPIIGYAISFPATDRDSAVSFAVHKQLLDQFNQQEEPELIEEEDED